jgi:hypothetical protein
MLRYGLELTGEEELHDRGESLRKSLSSNRNGSIISMGRMGCENKSDRSLFLDSSDHSDKSFFNSSARPDRSSSNDFRILRVESRSGGIARTSCFVTFIVPDTGLLSRSSANLPRPRLPDTAFTSAGPAPGWWVTA